MIKNALPFLLIIGVACSSPNQTQETTTTANTIKPVEELTFWEIVKSVMSDQGEFVEYHGEPTKEEALGNVELIASEEPCGEANCGVVYYIKNNSTRSIKPFSYSVFQVGTFDSYIASYFNLKPGEKKKLGCSHFCYDGKSYLFDHKIIGAEYQIVD